MMHKADTLIVIVTMSKSYGPSLRLMTWLSPAYPVGGFSYSQGLETAIEQGYVYDQDTAHNWILESLKAGPIAADAIFFIQAIRTLEKKDHDGFLALNTFALAYQSSREMKEETINLGASFLRISSTAWPGSTDLAWPKKLCYPCAVGGFVALHTISAKDAIIPWLQSMVASQISVLQKLGLIGQAAGQSILVNLEQDIFDRADISLSACMDDVTSSTFILDICSMNHEHQTTRIFQS